MKWCDGRVLHVVGILIDGVLALRPIGAGIHQVADADIAVYMQVEASDVVVAVLRPKRDTLRSP